MILQRYIAWSLTKGWLLVLAVLGAVFGLISFIGELDRTSGDYDTLAVAIYTLSVLPQSLVELAPVIALLGSIVALAGLDRYNELTVISCTGFPLRKLLAAIALPTLALMAVLWLAMEFVAPQLQQSAELERRALRYGDAVALPGDGVWSNNGTYYVNLRKMHEGNVPGQISLFEFGENTELLRALRAEEAEVGSDRTWLFKNVREKRLVEGRLVTREHEELEIGNLWAPDELPTLTLPSESMSLSVLYGYTEYRAANELPRKKYLSTFWQRLLMPLTVGAMVLLATPISANVSAGRDRSFGISMAIGAVLGILFYLGAQIIFALGQLLGLSIPLVAALPCVLVGLCALVMLRRMNW